MSGTFTTPLVMPEIKIRCERFNEYTGDMGSCYLNTVRVERRDDGVLIAVTDFWPFPVVDEKNKQAVLLRDLKHFLTKTQEELAALRKKNDISDAKAGVLDALSLFLKTTPEYPDPCMDGNAAMLLRRKLNKLKSLER